MKLMKLMKLMKFPAKRAVHAFVNKRNYSGLNQYFPRNALFLPPSVEGIARFALEKWMA